MPKPMKPKSYAGDSELDPSAPFKNNKSNEQLLREAKAKGPAALEAYYSKLASTRRVDAKKRAKEVTDEYNMRRSSPLTSAVSGAEDWKLAKSSNILSRKELGPGVTPKGEFIAGPLKADESRNMSRAKNARLKAIAAARKNAGK